MKCDIHTAVSEELYHVLEIMIRKIEGLSTQKPMSQRNLFVYRN
jgi:hypothetical protein